MRNFFKIVITSNKRNKFFEKIDRKLHAKQTPTSRNDSKNFKYIFKKLRRVIGKSRANLGELLVHVLGNLKNYGEFGRYSELSRRA